MKTIAQSVLVALALLALLSLSVYAQSESCSSVEWGGETVSLISGQILRNDDGNGSQWWGQGACSAEGFTIPPGGAYEITCTGDYTMDNFNGRVCDQVQQSGEEITIPWYQPGCNTAQVGVCSTDDDATRLYANGLYLGDCISVPLMFASRPAHTDTITLLSGSTFDLYALEVSCADFGSAGDDPEPVTPTLSTAEEITPSLGAQQVLDGGGFLGIEFGGSLSDPSAPVNQWLGVAEDFVGIVNTGNILYIIGAVAGAGAVLAWAIHTVRRPESF
jgi:hypothetical protein